MRTKHTRIYKDARQGYILSILFILIGGAIAIFPIRHIANDPFDFWTIYDGMMLAWLFTVTTHLYLTMYKQFREISAKERDSSWKTQRRRYEYFTQKERLETMKEVEEFLDLVHKVDYL